MLLKFRLEMDVTIDQHSEAAVTELAQQHYRREGTAPGRLGKPKRLRAEKFIKGTDQVALERNA